MHLRGEIEYYSNDMLTRGSPIQKLVVQDVKTLFHITCHYISKHLRGEFEYYSKIMLLS